MYGQSLAKRYSWIHIHSPRTLHHRIKRIRWRIFLEKWRRSIGFDYASGWKLGIKEFRSSILLLNHHVQRPGKDIFWGVESHTPWFMKRKMNKELSHAGHLVASASKILHWDLNTLRISIRTWFGYVAASEHWQSLGFLVPEFHCPWSNHKYWLWNLSYQGFKFVAMAQT